MVFFLWGYAASSEPHLDELKFGGGHKEKSTKDAILLRPKQSNDAGKPFVDSILRFADGRGTKSGVPRGRISYNWWTIGHGRRRFDPVAG
jgi:hypothetical protein